MNEHLGRNSKLADLIFRFFTKQFFVPKVRQSPNFYIIKLAVRVNSNYPAYTQFPVLLLAACLFCWHTAGNRAAFRVLCSEESFDVMRHERAAGSLTNQKWEVLAGCGARTDVTS